MARGSSRRLRWLGVRVSRKKSPDAADETTTHFVYHNQDVTQDAEFRFREQDLPLAGRLHNFKFEQALAYLTEEHDEDVTETVEALAKVFGNTGFMPRAQMEPILWATVRWIFGELQKLNQPDAVIEERDKALVADIDQLGQQNKKLRADIERLRQGNVEIERLRQENEELRRLPRLTRRPPFGDEGD